MRDKDYDEFKNNRMLQDAVIREIEIIGEAAKNFNGVGGKEGIKSALGDEI